MYYRFMINNIGDEIRLAIKKRGLTARDVALKIGVQPDSLTKSLLRGNIKYSKVKQIGDILGCPIEIK